MNHQFTAAHYLAGCDVLSHANAYLRGSRHWAKLPPDEAQAFFDARAILVHLELAALGSAERLACK